MTTPFINDPRSNVEFADRIVSGLSRERIEREIEQEKRWATVSKLLLRRVPLLLLALLSVALVLHVTLQAPSLIAVGLLSLAIIGAGVWRYWLEARHDRVPFGTVWARSRLGWLSIALLIPLAFGFAMHRQAHEGPARLLLDVAAPVSAIATGEAATGEQRVAIATFDGRLELGNPDDPASFRELQLPDGAARPVTQLLWRGNPFAGMDVDEAMQQLVDAGPAARVVYGAHFNAFVRAFPSTWWDAWSRKLAEQPGGSADGRTLGAIVWSANEDQPIPIRSGSDAALVYPPLNAAAADDPRRVAQPGLIAVREGEVLWWDGEGDPVTMWTGETSPLVAVDEGQRLVIVERRPLRKGDARYPELFGVPTREPVRPSSTPSLASRLPNPNSVFPLLVSLASPLSGVADTYHFADKPILPTAVAASGRGAGAVVAIGKTGGELFFWCADHVNFVVPSLSDIPGGSCAGAVPSGATLDITSITLTADTAVTRHRDETAISWTRDSDTWTAGAPTPSRAEPVVAGRMRLPDSDIELAAFHDQAPETITLPDGRIVAGGWDGRVMLIDPAAAGDMAGGPAAWIAGLWEPMGDAARTAFANLPLVGSSDSWDTLSASDRALAIDEHVATGTTAWLAVGSVIVRPLVDISEPALDPDAQAMAQEPAVGDLSRRLRFNVDSAVGAREGVLTAMERLGLSGVVAPNEAGSMRATLGVSPDAGASGASAATDDERFGSPDIQPLFATEKGCPRTISQARLQADPAIATSCVIERLLQTGQYEYVDFDYIAQPAQVSGAPVAGAMIAGQWALGADAGGANFTASRQAGAAQSSVIIAVVDSGIISGHPAVRGLSGLVDGYDMVSDPLMANDGDGRDADPEDQGDRCDHNDPRELVSDHGTRMIGLIAAAAPANAKIVPVRVLGRCGGKLSDINDGILWAAGIVPAHDETGAEIWNQNPADIINLSFEFPVTCPASLQDTIDKTVAVGVVVVAAAGNAGGNVSYSAPGGCRNVVSVGATDARGAPAPYSNHGLAISIWAPGGDLSRDDNDDGVRDGVVSWGLGGQRCVDPVTGAARSDCSHVMSSGTSNAAALATAALAILRAREPEATAVQLQQRLLAATRESCAKPRNARDRGACATWDGAPVKLLDASKIGAPEPAAVAADGSALPKRRVTDAGVDLIASFEGLGALCPSQAPGKRYCAFDDPAGLCTIGYGHLVTRTSCADSADALQAGGFQDGITEEDARALLRADLAPAQLYLESLLDPYGKLGEVGLTDYQYDALVSFIFNVGRSNFESSTLLRSLENRISIAGDEQIAAQFLRWSRSAGVALPALERRRRAEMEHFFKGFGTPVLRVVESPAPVQEPPTAVQDAQDARTPAVQRSTAVQEDPPVQQNAPVQQTEPEARNPPEDPPQQIQQYGPSRIPTTPRPRTPSPQ